MKGNKKTQAGFPPVDAELEWICAEASEIQVPGVEGMTTRLRVWLELPTDLVVSGDTPAPGEALPPIDESLRRAAWQPAEGPPRLPKVIRVADARTARRLQEINGLKCEVRQGVSPEADSFLEMLAQSMAEIDAREDYLQGGRIRASVVGDFFQAAKALYLLGPWRAIPDSDLIRVDIPALRVTDAYLSIIGRNGDSFGFLLFSSFDDYVSFADAAISNMEDDSDEGPDLNSSWVSLEFLPEEEISPKRLAQIKDRRWIVAGREAFPDVGRFDRGELAETRERDIRVLASCARALIPFLSKSGSPRFDINSLEGRSFVGPDGIEVFLEPAFDDEAEEGPHFEMPQLAPVPVENVGRNDLCPCGSGKKFKKCCLSLPSDGSSTRAVGDDVHKMDSRVVAQIQDFAWRRHKVSEKSIFREFANPAMNAQLAYPYFAYCSEVEGHRLVDLFLTEKGRNLSERERKWVEAQSRSWLSVWEVESVDRGTGMILGDLLTGERRAVVEKSGSSQAIRRMALLCRVVDFENSSVVCGTHVRPLPPREVADIIQGIRKHFRSKQLIPIPSLQNHDASRLMLAAWEQAVADLDAASRRRPVLKNTDGHSLVQTVDRFAFAPSDLNEIESRLARMEHVSTPQPDETPREFVFSRVNPPNSPMPSVTIGTVRIEQNTLVAETNSVKRADTLRKRIETACGSLLKPSLREHADVFAAAEHTSDADSPPTQEKEAVPPEIGAALLRDFKERFYSTWLDQPIPALGSKTPREAAKTAKGRSQLEVLLKELEYAEAQSTPEDPFDVSTLRAELGLQPNSGS